MWERKDAQSMQETKRRHFEIFQIVHCCYWDNYTHIQTNNGDREMESHLHISVCET